MWKYPVCFSIFALKWKNIMIKKLFVIIYFLCTLPVFAQNKVWSSLDKGNYKFGFKVLSLYDSLIAIISGQHFYEDTGTI